MPDWALTAVEPAHDKNNPILVLGRDPKRSDLIVVKARVNRGFGYFARTSVEPEGIHNSTYDQGLLDSTLKIVTELDRSFATEVTEVTGVGGWWVRVKRSPWGTPRSRYVRPKVSRSWCWTCLAPRASSPR